MDLTFNSVAVFLNRDCPHNCPQCGISKEKKYRMNSNQWKDTFKIFQDYYNCKFYLVLGVEPLLLGEELVDIVKYWSDNNIFYGLYSTSPKPLFEKYRNKLLDVGLNNWSCGIDGLPDKNIPQDVRKKIENGLEGVIWMAERGVQVMTVTTLTNYNLQYADKIIEWCQDNIKNAMSCLNPVEWQHNETFDFFSKKENMKDLIIPSDKRDEVKSIADKVKCLSKRKGYQIQNSDKNLDIFHLVYDTLNYRCNGKVGIGVDTDGSLRRCGYCRGREINKYNVRDIPKNPQKIFDIWYKDVLSCEGCFWSWVQGLEESFQVVIPKSQWYIERGK